ncbi:MAG: spermidine/putrescine transport system ATP-binding protein [Thermoleophilaceae bacterium]|jgi:spermidine/putrescine transport system ATP-binding protein|nr:spermidine/putrescine transport system ATP-binding protein [Thermoleophilaceae bacterium]MEA2400736.1 spermidine/putrescine transport system ATP-binding protein [Thermoleophilaceae bacterium]
MAGGDVKLTGLVKRFDDVVAVDGIDLHIPGGEFFSLLGPSGCGKTTTLRLIAGFDEPTAGEIVLDGVDMASTPAYRRNVNTVFQSYALFPHLSVFDNVAFGLRRERTGKAELRQRANEALEMVQMEAFADRRPVQLSGGQQQRVALARALVLKPAVLLLDEPLGALDAKLRRMLQVELKALQERVGITFIYVTHDQEEALTMSDRIAVMNQGRVEQVAPPHVVYEEPRTTFVAEFLGTANLMPAAAVRPADGGCTVRIGEVEMLAGRGEMQAAGDARVVIRPERVLLEPHDAPGPNRVPAMVERVVYLGSAHQVWVRLPTGDRLQVLLQSDGEPVRYVHGDPVQAYLPPDGLRVLAGDGEA